MLLARVNQGPRPVVGATVTAVVDRQDILWIHLGFISSIQPRNSGTSDSAVSVVLQDSGTGGDQVAGDGLYTAYFTQFLANQVRCIT